MNLNLQNSSKLFNQFTQFQRGIVDVPQKGNQLYQIMSVGSKSPTDIICIFEKSNSTSLFHSSKLFSQFTKDQKINLRHLGDFHVGLMGCKNPISLFYLKLKDLKYLVYRPLQVKLFNRYRSCLY